MRRRDGDPWRHSPASPSSPSTPLRPPSSSSSPNPGYTNQILKKGATSSQNFLKTQTTDNKESRFPITLGGKRTANNSLDISRHSYPEQRQHFRIRIFSRAAPSHFSWLLDGLRAGEGAGSADIRGVPITNHYTDFSQEARDCDFAILYHTLNHGRMNITNVTESLYDNELQDLSSRLGKEKVIVVADDLKRGDNAEKDRILQSQPSIATLARDLFLFTERQKNPQNLREISRIIRHNLRNPQADESSAHPRQDPGSASGSEMVPAEDRSNIYRAKVLEVPASSSRFVRSPKKSSWQEEDDEEPKPMKRKTETLQENVKEAMEDDLLEKLNKNTAIAEKTHKNVEELQRNVQQIREIMEEQLNNMESNIIKAMKQTLTGFMLEKEKRSEKRNEEREKELREREDEIKTLKKKLQEKEEEMKQIKEKMQRLERILEDGEREMSPRESQEKSEKPNVNTGERMYLQKRQKKTQGMPETREKRK